MRGALLRQSIRTVIPNTDDASLKQDAIAEDLHENPQPILEPCIVTTKVISNVWHDDFFNSIRCAMVELQSRVGYFRELQSV